MSQNPQQKGFTLAELLIALVILGVIAAFTIPKVLSSQRDSRFNSVAKEAAAASEEALDTLRLQGNVSSGTGYRDLTPYLNYVSVDTSRTIDDDYAHTTDSCGNGGRRCLILHSGAAIFYKTSETFGGTTGTNAIWFRIDPDGKVTTDGSAGTPGKSQEFLLYYNGRIEGHGDYLPGSASSSATYPADPSTVPDWFSWS